MNPSFVDYIDESGDEGFVFNGDGSGSSRWFVLSAAVIRKVNDLQMVSCPKDVRSVLGKPPKTSLHWNFGSYGAGPNIFLKAACFAARQLWGRSSLFSRAS